MQAQPRLTEDERINLVAFLDGELDGGDAQKLEDKAARSISVRKELDALEKTWTMLDWLPRPEAPPDFASQTLTRIHSQKLSAMLIEGRVRLSGLILAKLVGWAACVAAAVAVGFASVRYAWHDPSRDFIEHLDIVENLETYRSIPDIKFLEDVSRIGLFVEPMATPPSESPPADTPVGEPAAGPVPAEPPTG